MQICPTCKRKYADSIRFCLEDGTVLTTFNDPDAATLRVSVRETRQETRAGNNLAVGALATVGAILVGIVLIVGAFVAYYLWTRPTPSDSSKTTAGSNNGPSKRGLSQSKDDVARELEQINNEVGYALVHDDLTALDRLLASDYRYVSDTGLSLT